MRKRMGKARFDSAECAPGSPDIEETRKIFCELDELRHTDIEGDMEWKETARWIKFEEDVEEGGERWSKPHVATLPLPALFDLRDHITNGIVLLDLKADNFVEIIGILMNHMIATDLILEEHRLRVSEILLSRHRHQHNANTRQILSLTDLGRKLSLIGDDNKKDAISASRVYSRRGSISSIFSSDLQETKFNEHFLKKIPEGSEASNILVGEVDFLRKSIIAFVRLANAIVLADLTEVSVPTRFIFIMLAPTGEKSYYQEVGRSMATLMSDDVFKDVAYKATDRADLLVGIDEFLDQVMVLPPGEWDPTIRIEPPKTIPTKAARRASGRGHSRFSCKKKFEVHIADPTLMRTGRIFGGLIQDIKRKAPFYLSDFRDGLHVQTLASFFFMYFACLTPIITFGGLLGSVTAQSMAAMESLLGGAICGVSYHIFAGQPLTIIGSTGPVLVFESIVFHFCHEYHLNYLSFRFWIGMWVTIALLIIVAFDLSALVRYITRFTEESFAVLIALIFIYEAFSKLFHILEEAPRATFDEIRNFDDQCSCLSSNGTKVMNETHGIDNVKEYCKETNNTLIGGLCFQNRPNPDTFFFCIILFFITFFTSYMLKHFTDTRFFNDKARRIISDFAIMIAIIVTISMDAIASLDTPKLIVPSEFRPTSRDRGWIIYPFVNPAWTIPAALIPAFLCTILIFMDQQITAVIVNRKEHKLKKGAGYHLDLLVIAIQMGFCSLMGLPWFVAATVLSINHVRSLTRESESAAPGERPQFLGVREQRVTGILVFLFVGLSVFLTNILKYIPMPVLYGVFLYMGISSMAGIELCRRVLCVFMAPKDQPDYVFLRHVPLRRVYLFTAIQVLCLTILWTIKTIKAISIVFPLMVLAMCFIRKSLDWVFHQKDLQWLDDIMPESYKREKETPNQTLGPTPRPSMSRKSIESNDSKANSEVMVMTGAVNIPMKDGKTIKIPVDRITYNKKTNAVQISDKAAGTSLWNQLKSNELNHMKREENEKRMSDTVSETVMELPELPEILVEDYQNKIATPLPKESPQSPDENVNRSSELKN